MTPNRWPRRIGFAGVIFFGAVVGISLSCLVCHFATLIARLFVSLL